MNPVTGLALGRIAIGIGALVSPDLAAKLFQLDAKGNPQLPYMTRMFASREIALGALTLMSSGSARRRLVAFGIAVDASDAFAGVTSVTSGSVSKPVGAFLTLPALGAVAAGAAGLFERSAG
ncbi:MAG: hypothetical protein JWR35_3024 [Marmoricola sp.]|jgi:hypothetical protein|nr:hypothetical protein [Marmoricola sp.]